ncbi:MAG: methyltransferase domain-containing protein [Dehalococcoidales bacterium]|nr:methyltransferase domain-containing protein [Dehalococcoidales bacterium]
MKKFKRLVQKSFNALGYNITRLPGAAPVKHDLSLYRRLYSGDSIKNRRFYNIGAGAFAHEAWTNVDHRSERYDFKMEIDWDLLALVPVAIASDTAEVVYSSHTIEHITDAAAQNLFNESYRILKKGGYLRLTTPDADLYCRAYMEKDPYFFYERQISPDPKAWKPSGFWSIQQAFLYEFASSLSTMYIYGQSPVRLDEAEVDQIFREMKLEDALSYCTSKCLLEIQKQHPSDHINWWNYGKLCAMLKAAGFAKIYRSGYGQSHCPVLRDTSLFDSTHPKISIYVEAVKS